MLTDGLPAGALEVEDVVHFVRSLEYAYDCRIDFFARLRYDSEDDRFVVLSFTAHRSTVHSVLRFGVETAIRMVKDDPLAIVIHCHNLVEMLGDLLSNGIPPLPASPPPGE